MNAVLGLFRSMLHTIWNEVYNLADEELYNATQRCFSVLNSREVVDTVSKFNSQARDTQKLPLRHCEMTTFDFARLYTNIPLLDLRNRLLSVIQQCFARASTLRDRPVVIVDKNGKATWNTEGSTATQCASFFFTEERLNEAVHLIVNETYFVFGSVLYHQDKVIPMRINCAVHMADQYLWTYEMEFLSQIVEAVRIGKSENASKNAVIKSKRAVKLLKYFSWTCRYIDDLLTLGNPHLKKLLYVTSSLWGFKGIYPVCLTFSQTNSGPSVEFLDMEIFQGEDCTLIGDARNALLIKLFDKRRGKDTMALILSVFLTLQAR